jgi:hypothetical protein
MDPAFSNFEDAKKIIFFFIFFSSNFFLIACFSYNLPTGTLSSVLKIYFLLKFCVKILFCKHYFGLLNTFLTKRKDPESDPDPDPYL